MKPLSLTADNVLDTNGGPAGQFALVAGSIWRVRYLSLLNSFMLTMSCAILGFRHLLPAPLPSSERNERMSRACPPRYKQSGIGRELGSYALNNYTQVKTVLWDYSDRSE